jgi:hypothetical protein
MLTLAPGTRAPELSTTLPLIDPETTCALDVLPKRRKDATKTLDTKTFRKRVIVLISSPFDANTVLRAELPTTPQVPAAGQTERACDVPR